MALGGFSSRFVHPRGTSTVPRRNSLKSPTAPIGFVTSDVVIGCRSSERESEAARNGAGTRVAEIVDTARLQAGGRIKPRLQVRDLRIQTRVAGEHEQVVGRHVEPGTASRSREHRQVESVFHREILEARGRSTFDPTGGVDGPLMNN